MNGNDDDDDDDNNNNNNYETFPKVYQLDVHEHSALLHFND
jgi:hypothetical protein